MTGRLRLYEPNRSRAKAQSSPRFGVKSFLIRISGQTRKARVEVVRTKQNPRTHGTGLEGWAE